MCARYINSQLDKVETRLPLISEIFRKLIGIGFKVCSSIDLKGAYHQLRLPDSGGNPIFVFSWGGQSYEFIRGFFGLNILPEVLQRMMDTVLGHLSACCIWFFDDILIFSPSLEQHIIDVNAVISVLTANRIIINFLKSKFGYARVGLLGHILSSSAMMPDPAKVRCISNWPVPTTGAAMRAFLGTANYLRDYIPHLATLTAPMRALVNRRKISAEEWEGCVDGFNTIREVLAADLPISAYRADLMLHVACDASLSGVGAMLYQETQDGERLYIAFASKSLDKHQRRYGPTKRELLAIVFALKQWYCYLYGRRFVLYTDHKALTFIFTQRDVSMVMLRWYDFIVQFDFEPRWLPGVLMAIPDTLSRLYASSWRLNYEDVELPRVPVPSLQSVFFMHLGADTARPEDELNGLIKERLDKTCPPLADRPAIIADAHAKGHHHADALFKRILREGFFWFGMRKECMLACSHCWQCILFNVQKRGYYPISVFMADTPMEKVAVDMEQALMTTPRGNNANLVYVCVFSGYVVVRAVSTLRAYEVAWTLFSIMCDYGIPHTLISDLGGEFVNTLFKDVAEILKLHHHTSPAYAKEQNGVAEGAISRFRLAQKKMVGVDVKDWDLYNPAVQLACNTNVFKSFKSDPFSVLMNRPAVSVSKEEGALPMSPDLLSERAKMITQLIWPALKDKKTQALAKRGLALDRKRRLIKKDLPLGTLVNRLDTKRSTKMDPVWVGPYTVSAMEGKSYVLSTLDVPPRTTPRVPFAQLKVIAFPDDDSAFARNLRSRSFTVDRILAHRDDASGRKFKVRWEGYGPEHDSWEPTENFDDPALVTDYLASLD